MNAQLGWCAKICVYRTLYTLATIVVNRYDKQAIHAHEDNWAGESQLRALAARRQRMMAANKKGIPNAIECHDVLLAIPHTEPVKKAET